MMYRHDRDNGSSLQDISIHYVNDKKLIYLAERIKYTENVKYGSAEGSIFGPEL